MACAVLLAVTPARAQTPDVALSAYAAMDPIAETNRRLIGVGWDAAAFTPRAMAPLRPDLVRMDASLERLYPRGPKLDETAFAALRTEVTEVLSIGATPVVILSYTPAWLAETRPSSDATKVPPSDPMTWRRLVGDVVDRLSALGVRWFEAWNEPDVPVFFQGLQTEFFEKIYRPSAEAVRDVARRTRRHLRFGGCACSTPNPAWIVHMMQFARENSLPLDFISWHYYGNLPFFGPDGAEPLGPPEIRPLLAPLRQRNPVTSAASYGDQIAAVRSWRDALYDEGEPELWLDEWNLSSGGFDRRHDTAEGAAFQAAVLVELQRADVDRAAVFRSVDPAYGSDVVPLRPEPYGGWGLVGRYGTIKPAWRAHRFWAQLGRDILAYTSSVDARAGVSGLLTRRDPRSVVAFVSNFVASGGERRRVVVRLEGAARGTWMARVTSLDGRAHTRTVRSRGELVVPIDLDAQTAVLVELRTTR